MNTNLELLFEAIKNSNYYKLNQIDVSLHDETIYVIDKSYSETKKDTFHSTGIIVLVDAFNMSNYIKSIKGVLTLIIF